MDDIVEAAKKEWKALQAEQKLKVEKKVKSLYYSTRSLMGIPWWWIAWIIGSRGRGKSFSAVDTVLSFQDRYGIENVKCYYFRLSDLSVKSMLENKAAKAIDAMLMRKYKMQVSVKGNTVFNHGKPCMYFYALVSAAKKGKGVAEYDPEFLGKRPVDPKTGKKKKRFIFIILDEFMIAEGLEKRNVGNPVEQFKIYMENILRDQERLDYPAVRVFACANAVSECSDFLAQIAGFIPERPGRFPLKRRHMIVENIPNSEAYIEKRKKSYGADLMDYEKDANYTNVIKRDLETLIPKKQQLNRPTCIIKFRKDEADWYTVWDGNIIRRWNGQKIKNTIPMMRHLEDVFDEDRAKSVIERYDARAFRYADLISQATFAAHLKVLKSK